MCEYCTSNLDDRGEKIIHGENDPVYRTKETVNCEIKIWLDNIDDNLMIQDVFNFSSQSDRFGYICKFGIEYCPWCGRKLHND